MAVKKDSLGRYVITDRFDDVKLHVDVEGNNLEFYFGHMHQAVNDRLEELDAKIMFDADTLIELVKVLVHEQGNMRKAELK